MSELKKFAEWLVMWACILTSAVWLIGQTPFARNDTDPGAWGERSRMEPRTDSLTGCQYLATSGGGLTPRVDVHGRHMGCKA